MQRSISAASSTMNSIPEFHEWILYSENSPVMPFDGMFDWLPYVRAKVVTSIRLHRLSHQVQAA